MAHLSRWLDEQDMELAALTDEAAERFQRARRERYSHLTGSRALRRLLEYLRGVGLVPEPLALESRVEAVVAAYREFLLRERGLVEIAYRRERPIPFFFTAADIERTMRAAGQLRGELHAATTQTLIGLMAVTGIRVGEAIGLGRDAIDRRERLIWVIDGKFPKSREIAVCETTIAALDGYAEVRDRVCPRPRSDAFFLSRNGTRLRYQCVRLVFMRPVAAAGLEDRSPRSRPRPHSLRHKLRGQHAARLVRRRRRRAGPAAAADDPPGHVTPASIYYYLTAAPDLLALAAKRLEPATERTCDERPGADA